MTAKHKSPTNDRNRIFPRALARVLSIAVLVIATATWVGCESKADKSSEESTTNPNVTKVSLTATDGIKTLLEVRLLETANQRLPAAIEAKEIAEARRLCDIARIRAISYRQNLGEMPKEMAAVEKRCGGDVAFAVLEAFYKRVSSVGEDDKRNACDSGAVKIGFTFDFPSNEPRVTETRDKIFEACPTLKEQWDKANDLKDEAPSE